MIMTIASYCTEATVRARTRGSETFSVEILRNLSEKWLMRIHAEAGVGAAECTIKTSFSSSDCAAQSGVIDYFVSRGFKAVPSVFIAGEHRQLQFTVTWPPE